MRAIFIRHGQSAANAGHASHEFSEIPLTAEGHEQARRLAASWTVKPDRIILSPFLRTRQTAQPTCERFPDVPTEVWPVYEFTNLDPALWNGSLPQERLPAVQRYWERLDPELCEGPGAESFATLLERARSALRKLTELPQHTTVFVFSHGFFLNAVRSLLRQPEASDLDHMTGFVQAFREATIANVDRLELLCEDGHHWTIVKHHSGADHRSAEARDVD